MNINDFRVLWLAFCSLFYLGVHRLTVSKGFEIYNRYSIKLKVKLEDFISFLFLVFTLLDFYFDILLWLWKLLLVLSQAQKLLNLQLIVSKGAVAKACALKGTGRKACRRHFKHELANGSVHITTEYGKDKAHRAAKELFIGKTPVGERLGEFKEYPGNWIAKGIDKDEIYNFPEHLEVIIKRIKEIGPHELFKHILDAGVELLF